MKNQKVIFRFDEVCIRNEYELGSLIGTATISSMIKLIDIADLHANPREPKVGSVTAEIQDSLEETPQLFHFKTKGILLSSGECKELERKRFELYFNDDKIEGILDGGHNLLAIGLFILRKALGEHADKELRSVKKWDDFINIWRSHRSSIDTIQADLNFLTPVEIIYPRASNEGIVDFESAILDVASARNNNAQLNEEAKSHKAGHYDEIKRVITDDLKSQVEWKTNDGGRIKVRDLVALCWIPLSVIPKINWPDGAEINPSAIYNSKAHCVTAFSKLMESEKISRKGHGDTREITHAGVKSAINMMKDIPRLYDLIYKEFPEAYNAASPRFGGISSVSKWDKSKVHSKEKGYLSRQPHTKFYREPCNFDYPDGFIMPILWALRSLMEYKNGIVQWKTDPAAFIKKNLKETMKVFHGLIAAINYDPQKVGKTSAYYAFAENDFATRL